MDLIERLRTYASTRKGELAELMTEAADALERQTCDDAVSRQAVIDALEKVAELYPWRVPGDSDSYSSYNEAWQDALNRVENEIEALPSVHPQRWIPCSERLPEESGSYFVSGKWASGRVAVGDCEYSKDDGYFQTAWNFDVIAWMPLPEPYKGE